MRIRDIGVRILHRKRRSSNQNGQPGQAALGLRRPARTELRGVNQQQVDVLRELKETIHNFEIKTPPKKGIERAATWIGTLIRLLALALVCVLAYIILTESRDANYIEGFEVPSDLAKSGYSSGVIANKLSDKINFVAESSKSDVLRGTRIRRPHLSPCPKLKSPASICRFDLWGPTSRSS
jgi:hypothetical protein